MCFQLLFFSQFFGPFPPAENLQTLCWSIHQMETWLKPVSSQCCLVPIPLACICNFHWMSLWTCGPHLTQNVASWCSICTTTIKSTCNSAKHQKQTDYDFDFGHVQSVQVIQCLCDVWYCGSLHLTFRVKMPPKSSNWLKDPCHCSQMRLLHMDCHPALVCTCVQMSYTKRLLKYGKVCPVRLNWLLIQRT